MSHPAWWNRIPSWVKVLGALLTVFLAGATAQRYVGAQIGLPAEVGRIKVEVGEAKAKVDTLGARMEAVEEAIGIVNKNSSRLDTLGIQMDAVYCVQEATVMKRDLNECLFRFRRAGGGGGHDQ